MNQAINLFWTILCFIPIGLSLGSSGNLVLGYAFLAISLLVLLVPLRFWTLSHQPAFYERTGVKIFRKFVQNGDFVNRLSRNTNPGYRVIKNKQQAVQYLKTAKMQEFYHLICLVFFTLNTVYAIVQRYYLFALIIALANLFYNIYPILLQQYNRARIVKIIRETDKF